MKLHVFAASGDSAVRLAADELVRYGNGVFVLTDIPDQADIVLHSENSDRLQDAFHLHSRDGKLFITGSNPRSVLYGVYRYLKHFGFAFLYPGPEGEVIPEHPDFTVHGFDIREEASYPFRGLAFRPPYRIEENGGKSFDDAFLLLSWMAKNQYNLFFMEGYDAERPGDKYSVIRGRHPLQHVEYSLQGKTWRERKLIAGKQRLIVEEARKYGFLIERGGHGWNCGVPEHFAFNHHISVENARAALKAKGKVNKEAEVAVSTWFQICLGREEVREIYADHIISFLAEHRGEMDIAAIWMGDGYDNKCQCADCLKQPFSDLYLDIFRRVALKAKKFLPELTLECLIYFETLEPPTQNWLEGLDNVILNLAVWRQCYFHKLDDPACRLPGWIPDYRRNATHDVQNDKRIINYDQYLPYAGWRKIVGNDVKCLVFNYITWRMEHDRHFMSYDLKPLLEYSLEDFDRLRIDGMVDCQCHSSWDKPANLQLYGAGRYLWNKQDNDPVRIRGELFSGLYGKKAGKVAAYCDRMSEALQSCGDYHASLNCMPELEKKLAAKLKRLETELDQLGKLPSGREKYFRESLAALKKQTTRKPGEWD